MTDALLRASALGALFAGAVWIACRLFPRMPAWLRCSLWWLACLKVLVSLASPIDLPVLPAEPLGIPVAIWGAPGEAAPVAPPVAQSAPEAAAPGLSWPAVLVAIWLAGLAAQLAWTARQLREARRIVGRSEPADDPWLAGHFAELRRRLGMGERCELRVSEDVEAPQVLGLIRPVVLLPAARPLSPADLSMALCHELVHVRRADLWWGWVPAVAQRLFWFHPLVRLASREYALAREAACDAEVLRVLDPEPHAYGRLLLRLGVAPRASCTAAAGAAPSVQSLKRRLQMLEQASRKRLSLVWVSLIVVLALVAVVPFRMVAQEAEAPESLPAPPAPPAPAALPAGAPAATAPLAQPSLPGRPTAAAPVAQVQRVPPVPPIPPVPPVPPTPWSGSKDESYILLLGKSRTMMNGSMSDIRKAKELQKGAEPLLYFRRGGKAYVVRDAAFVLKAGDLFKMQAELGAKQGELGARQGELGAKQGELGAQQGALGARQAALALNLARQALDGESDDSLEAEMEELGKQQEELGRKQAELGEKQAELGEKQAELGEKQAELGREAEKKFRVLVDEAVRNGLAQEVK
ncbi:MAG TPA: M56 family metallopeptidase [Thermoanaerobaculia bacterium]|nr:M56 family metallopeptidase [Thermoanaerobaculia bacterium]